MLLSKVKIFDTSALFMVCCTRAEMFFALRSSAYSVVASRHSNTLPAQIERG